MTCWSNCQDCQQGRGATRRSRHRRAGRFRPALVGEVWQGRSTGAGRRGYLPNHQHDRACWTLLRRVTDSSAPMPVLAGSPPPAGAEYRAWPRPSILTNPLPASDQALAASGLSEGPGIVISGLFTGPGRHRQCCDRRRRSRTARGLFAAVPSRRIRIPGASSCSQSQMNSPPPPSW